MPTKKPLRKIKTVLQRNLKNGIEKLAGINLDDVNVHYNGTKPGKLNAQNYAQGAAIHLAPGQQQHLPHKAWHVVQQKQGRIKATDQPKAGVMLNNDPKLEHEADLLGTKASESNTGNVK